MLALSEALSWAPYLYLFHASVQMLKPPQHIKNQVVKPLKMQCIFREDWLQNLK